MKVVTAREAHRKLGVVLDDAQHAPVAISKNGRPFSIIISAKLFEKLGGERALEDREEEDLTQGLQPTNVS